jgi:two-component system KDP operon response regulator KdpE
MSVRKILVVDDDMQMRRVLRSSLRANGYDVVAAASGEEAVAQFRRDSFDLVLLDLNLPGFDGLETCRTLRTHSRVPIIIVSVRDSQMDKASARRAGANSYITKPFGIEELLAHISELNQKTTEPNC